MTGKHGKYGEKQISIVQKELILIEGQHGLQWIMIDWDGFGWMAKLMTVLIVRSKVGEKAASFPQLLTDVHRVTKSLVPGWYLVNYYAAKVISDS